jgi:diacylglycerol kinase family enzyme
MKSKQIFIICNPEAGGGLARKKWVEFQSQLEANRIRFEYQFTAYPEHAIKISSSLLEKGYRRIAIFGGDGTLNEVLQGVFADDKIKSPELQLIFLGAGSSCDFEKMFPRKQSLIERILGKEPYTVDICKVKCQDLNGSPTVRYFLVNSNIGVISLAIKKFDAAKLLVKWLKQVSVDAAALTAGLSALIQFDKLWCDIKIDQEEFKDQRLKNLTVFKCPYFGGGMHYGVKTQPDDGLLHAATIDSVPRVKLLGMIPALYTGKIFNQKAAHYKKFRSLELFCHQKVFIEADGEIIGSPPAKYSILKKAIKVIV